MSEGLREAAKTALQSCMALNKDETLLIVTDDNKQSIGQALYDEGQKLAKEALLVTMPPARVDDPRGAGSHQGQVIADAGMVPGPYLPVFRCRCTRRISASGPGTFRRGKPCCR